MFKIIKDFINKFNKKENEQKVEEKKKSKVGILIGAALVMILSIALSEHFLVDLTNTTIISSSPIKTSIKLDNGYIIEEFPIEDILNKKTSESIIAKGLYKAEPLYKKFIDGYNFYNLKILEEKEFKLLNGYQYSDELYRYTYNPNDQSLVVTNGGINYLTYTNVDNIVRVNILIDNIEYKIIYGDNQLTLEVNDEMYLFGIINNELVLTYEDEEQEYCEYYSIRTCSLIEIKSIIYNNIYHTFVYNEISNNIELKLVDGKYFFVVNDREISSFNMNHELAIANYYITDGVEVYIEGEIRQITCFVILDTYYQENGFPLNFIR